MQQSQRTQSIVPLLKSYNACLTLTIVCTQAALSFAIPIYTSTSSLLTFGLAVSVLTLHLLGAFRFSRSLRLLGVDRMRMIALYTLIPFGNIICIVELTKAVNASLKAIGAMRGMKYAEILEIEGHNN